MNVPRFLRVISGVPARKARRTLCDGIVQQKRDVARVLRGAVSLRLQEG